MVSYWFAFTYLICSCCLYWLQFNNPLPPSSQNGYNDPNLSHLPQLTGLCTKHVFTTTNLSAIWGNFSYSSACVFGGPFAPDDMNLASLLVSAVSYPILHEPLLIRITAAFIGPTHFSKRRRRTSGRWWTRRSTWRTGRWRPSAPASAGARTSPASSAARSSASTTPATSASPSPPPSRQTRRSPSREIGL